ncbi:MAG: CRISPR-associated endonuclease Cas3'', partial [Acetobacteraceae bacterium]|nr:CRISPR-associated endonuclease Cas3'' [Acetobacteraceae bacterium]
MPELLLPDHAADVAAVLRALLHGPVLRARLAALGGWADLPPAQEAAMLGAAFLHDIGKANAGFQRKRLPEGGRGPVAGHVAEAAALLRLGSRAEVPVRGADSYLDPWAPAGAYLLAALGHHGRPLPRDGLPDAARMARRVWQGDGAYEPVAAAEALIAALHRWLPDAAAAMPDPEPPAAVLHAFAGLVSLADWIASNDAAGFFPYPIEGDRWAFAVPRAAEVVAAMRFDLAPARAELAARAPGFAQVFGVAAPTPVQKAMTDPSLGQVVLLEAATGSGKTEAALWRWQHLLREGAVDGLAFLLPTRTSAVQMYDRVGRAVAALWPDEAVRPNIVLAVPGYLRADGAEGTRLPGFRVLWDDDRGGARAHARWAAESPRRGLAGAVVVGTVDQALMAALTTKHAHLRGACLLRHLLVVDEVHASDAYMTELLRTLLARQVAAGGHALLLSATLGAAARARVL